MKPLKEVINGSRRLKGKGKMFSRWSYTDYRHLKFDFNIESTEVFKEGNGDISKLESFICDCEDGCFINYDGYATEILLDGKIIWNKSLAPSDVLFYKIKLRELNKQFDNKLKIVWYNR